MALDFENNNYKLIFDSISKVINSGIKLIASDLSEDKFNIWFNYSLKILKITAKTNTSYCMNYLIRTQISTKNLPPSEKLKFCIQHLIDILKNIN